MALARALRKVARKQIDRFGTTATLTETVSTVNGASGSSSDVVTDYAGKCIVETFADRLVDGSNILASDRKLTFAASGLDVTPAPVTTDGNVTTTYAVTVGGETFQVHRAEPVYAEDSVVLWTIHGRK